jgi:hypothetical protein
MPSTPRAVQQKGGQRAPQYHPVSSSGLGGKGRPSHPDGSLESSPQMALVLTSDNMTPLDAVQAASLASDLVNHCGRQYPGSSPNTSDQLTGILTDMDQILGTSQNQNGTISSSSSGHAHPKQSVDVWRGQSDVTSSGGPRKQSAAHTWCGPEQTGRDITSSGVPQKQEAVHAWHVPEVTGSDYAGATSSSSSPVKSEDGVVSSGGGQKPKHPKKEGAHACQVCGDVAAGFHCGAYVCEACKKFFVRCLKQDSGEKLMCSREKSCVVTK